MPNIFMRGQVLSHCKRLILSRGPSRSTEIGQTLRSLTCQKQHWNQKWLLQPESKHPQIEQHRRLMSTDTSPGHRDVFLPGNVLRSPFPDETIPEISFHEFLLSHLDEFQELPALSEFCTGKGYTYKELKVNVIKVASALTRLGYKKGDTITAFSTNHIDFPVLMIAASCLGIIFSAASPAFTAGELARQVTDSDSKALFITPELAQITKEAIKSEELSNKHQDVFVFGESEGLCPFQKLLEDDGKAFPDVAINPKEDVYLLPYSSGTTGFPKGVMLTHYNIVANLHQLDEAFNIKAKDNILGLLPLYHLYGMVAIQFSSLMKGGHVHYLPNFEPESFLQCMQDRKINKAHLVPPLVLFLAKHPMVSDFDLSNLSKILSAAAPLGKELTFELKKRFSHEISINQGYGMTELSPGSNIDKGENIPSVGPLLCNTFGRIVNTDTGESLGPHQEGELWIKGPQVMKGYHNNKKATDDMIDSEGWLHTGDIGYYNEKGLFFISDRLKELIKYKAFQVAPAELEALLLGHKDVLDVAVIGVPDDHAGELPLAYIVKRPNSDVMEGDIIKYVEENVAPVKRLRGGVRFIEEIPKSPSGKILRRLLRKE